MRERRPHNERDRDEERRREDSRGSSRTPLNKGKQGKESADEVDIDKVKKDYTVLQHPTTLIPIAIGVVSSIFLVVVGGGVPALVVAGGSGLVGLGAMVWRMLGRGKYIDEKTKELLLSQAEKRKREEEQRIVELRGAILRGFTEIGSKEGLKELGELVSEYEDLVAVLHRIPQGADVAKLISIERIKQLAIDTYHQGLLALHRAWETMREVESANRYSLEQEAAAFEKEVARLERAEPQSELLVIERESLARTKQRLGKINQQALMIKKLLAQSDKCEAELQQTRLDVIVLSNEGSGEKADEVMKRLQDAIDTAIAVQEELTKFNRGLSA